MSTGSPKLGTDWYNHDATWNLIIQKLDEEARFPQQMSNLAAGLDVFACESVNLKVGARALVSTGIAIALPPGFEAQVRPRSGLAVKHGVTVLNTPGTIDADYRGEVKVLLINLGQEPFTVQKGERIAQLVFNKVEIPFRIRQAPELPATARGSGGFGSTGAA